jgi:UDP-N-acetylmuramoyl-tripeptide--D-alanyl-D-alanine ligase
MLTIDHVLQALGQSARGWTKPITGGAIDSRVVQAGNLFVAVPGEQTDGHRYLAQAFERGATLALIQQPMSGFDVLDCRPTATTSLPPQFTPYEQPLCLLVTDTVAALQQIARYWRKHLAHVRVIGITGSIGKTTTKEVAANVLSQRYRTLKNIGNFNNEIGLPLTLLQLNSTHERAVLEMGFYQPGEIAFLCEIARPDIGIITNVYAVHAERAGDIQNIIQGKGELVEHLPAHGVAIINADQPEVIGMAARTRARIFSYGLTHTHPPQPDLYASDVRSFGLHGIHLRLHHRDDVVHVSVPLLGQHSAHTVLRAAALGLVEGLSWQEIIDGLQDQQAAQLRLQLVAGPNGSQILDDTYNASPESTIAALNLLADIPARRRVAVLGDMRELGQYTEQGHRLVGGRVTDVADLLVTVGQMGALIAKTASQNPNRLQHIEVCPDQQAAVNFLRPQLQSGDLVLVKGSRAVHLDRLVRALES